MANSNETTTKLGVDISELKKGLQDASRQMRLANSEFKAAAAGMDDWSKSSEGLEAKITQLGSILDAEKKKLSILEQQYAAVAAEQGANSKAAEELMIKINNQKASIGNTEKQLRTYNTKLDDCRTAAQELAQEQTDTANSFDKLKGKVSDQEQELKNLKDEYANLVIEQGKESEAAKKCANKISALSDDLKENRSKLDDATGAADDLTNSFEETDTASDNASDGFTVMKGALATLAADGIKACIDALKDFAIDSQTAYNNFAAQTGTATEEMSKFEDEINALYKNNYGDSLNDIADVMAEIKKQTGEVDASKLSELSENAITLRDTFGYDVVESIRAANMLMQQFGLDGDEAYGLIAEGAQNGLDKNGDLLDTINEYSSYYSAQGYSAEEFYHSLKNGSEAGTFSVDKLGDAMKEFGIRTKDSSDTTAQAFQTLGIAAGDNSDAIKKTKEDIDKYETSISKLEKNLKYAEITQKGFTDKTSELTRLKLEDNIKQWNDELKENKDALEKSKSGLKEMGETGGQSVNELFGEFAEGGETARGATKKVLKALYNMDDKVQQDAAGVALFGTMWEDLGKDGVKALMDVDGELGDTKQTMEEIKKVKYDDVVNQIKTLGRTAQQDILVPLAEKIIPKVESFVKWCIENFDSLVPILEGVGAALLTAFVVTKLGAMATAITTLVGAVKAWKLATDAQTTSQLLLNSAQLASPIGLAAAAIGLLVGGIVAWTAATDDQALSEAELYAEIDETNKRLADNKKAYDDAAQARADAVADTSAEFAYYQSLKDELDGIVDKNGKVKEGYENRAAFIVSTLSEATGQEIEMNNGVIESYDKISQSIDNLILKKQAEAQLANYDESYNTAISNRTQAYNDLVTAQDNYKKVTDDLKTAKDNLAAAEDGVAEASGGSDLAIQVANNTLMDATSKVKELESKQKDANKAVSDAQSIFTGYQDTIKNYEGVSAAIIEGDTEKIKSSLNNLTSNFVNAENGTKTSLENQVKNMKLTYDNLKKAVEEKQPGVTQEMVDGAKEMVDKSVVELHKFESQAEAEGEAGGAAVTLGLSSKARSFEQAAEQMALKGRTGLSFYDYNATGQQEGTDFVNGLASKNGAASTAGKGLGNSAKTGAGSVSSRPTGLNFGITYIDGVDSKQSDAETAGEELGESAETGANSVEGDDAGSQFGEGFAGGVRSWLSGVGSAASELAGSALSSLKEKLGINSPSKVAAGMGKFFDLGFANGITDNVKAAVKATKTLVANTLQPLETASVDVQAGIKAASNATSTAGGNNSSVTNNTSTVTNNFYQTNNSPKPLSRLDIYRQSKNLLTAKGG